MANKKMNAREKVLTGALIVAAVIIVALAGTGIAQEEALARYRTIIDITCNDMATNKTQCRVGMDALMRMTPKEIKEMYKGLMKRG